MYTKQPFVSMNKCCLTGILRYVISVYLWGWEYNYDFPESGAHLGIFQRYDPIYPTSQIVPTSIKTSLRKHPFLLALRRWGRFAFPPRETVPAAKSEEKRMFSQARQEHAVYVFISVVRSSLSKWNIYISQLTTKTRGYPSGIHE